MQHTKRAVKANFTVRERLSVVQLLGQLRRPFVDRFQLTQPTIYVWMASLNLKCSRAVLESISRELANLVLAQNRDLSLRFGPTGCMATDIQPQGRKAVSICLNSL